MSGLVAQYLNSFCIHEVPVGRDKGQAEYLSGSYEQLIGWIIVGQLHAGDREGNIKRKWNFIYWNGLHRTFRPLREICTDLYSSLAMKQNHFPNAD